MAEMRRAVRRLYLTDHPLIKELLVRKMQLRVRMNSPYYENRTGRDEILQLMYIPAEQIEDGILQNTVFYPELLRCEKDHMVMIYNGFEEKRSGDIRFRLLAELTGLDLKRVSRIRTEYLNVHSPGPEVIPSFDVTEEEIVELKMKQWAKRRINERVQEAFDEMGILMKADYELLPLYRNIFLMQKEDTQCSSYRISENSPYDYLRLMEDVAEETDLDILSAEEVLEELFKEGVITWPYAAGKDILITDPELAEEAGGSCRSNQTILDLLNAGTKRERPMEMKSGITVMIRFLKLSGAGNPEEILHLLRRLNQAPGRSILFREGNQYRIDETGYGNLEKLTGKLFDFSITYTLQSLLESFTAGDILRRKFISEIDEMEILP